MKGRVKLNFVMALIIIVMEKWMKTFLDSMTFAPWAKVFAKEGVYRFARQMRFQLVVV